MPVIAYEISDVKYLEQQRRNNWVAIRSYLCDSSKVPGFCMTKIGEPFNAITGWKFKPLCYRTKAWYQWKGITGVALIHCYYATGLVPGEAIIRTRVNYKAKRVDMDLSGTPIYGPDNTNALYEWEILQGDNIILDVDTIIQVETALPYSQYNPWNLDRAMNTLNSMPFNLRGLRAGKTLWFLGYEALDRYREDPIPITYKFAYRRMGWDNYVKSLKGSWIVRQAQVYDDSGNAKTGEFREIKAFRRGYDAYKRKDKNGDVWIGQATKPESRLMQESYSWSGIFRDHERW